MSNPEPLPCNALGLWSADSTRYTWPVTTLGKAETVSPSPCHGPPPSPVAAIVMIKAAGLRSLGWGLLPVCCQLCSEVLLLVAWIPRETDICGYEDVTIITMTLLRRLQGNLFISLLCCPYWLNISQCHGDWPWFGSCKCGISVSAGIFIS